MIFEEEGKMRSILKRKPSDDLPESGGERALPQKRRKGKYLPE